MGILHYIMTSPDNGADSVRGSHWWKQYYIYYKPEWKIRIISLCQFWMCPHALHHTGYRVAWSQWSWAVRLKWPLKSKAVAYVDGSVSLCSFCEEAGSGTEYSPGQSHRSFTHSWHAACSVAKADGDPFLCFNPSVINTLVHNTVHHWHSKL